MATDANSSTIGTTAPRPRRRWFRFLYQFSLRTMLVGMTLAAVACWWFLQPPTQEEELAGQYLKLRRQVRVSGGPDSLATDVATGNVSQERTITSVGKWRLFNENDDLLVNGRYENDLPQGKWTLWHANGRKAAEGDVFRGGRTGVWRVWDERGTLRSEVTYRAVAPTPPGWRWSPRPRPPFVTSPIPVVGMIGPVGQLAWGWGPSAAALRAQALAARRYDSQRHGPCRVWYASGQLQFEGQYADDRRDGVWIYYDEQGKMIEKGPYKADLREGDWMTHRRPHAPREAFVSRSETPTMVTYVAGRTQAEHDALLARLAAELATGSVRRQVAAAKALEQLGTAGVPVLVQALTHDSPAAQTLALRTLMRMGAISTEMLPQIEPLTSHSDSRLALRATLAVYVLSPGRRSELYPRLMTQVDQAAGEDIKIEVLQAICECDPDRQMLAFLALAEMLTKRSSPIMQNPYLPIEWEQIRDLRTDPVPLLAAAFGHSDRDVRLYVLRVLELIVESGPAKAVNNPDGSTSQAWPVPAAVKAVLDKAQTDPDPDVRSRAEMVGKQDWGGMGGGFF